MSITCELRFIYLTYMYTFFEDLVGCQAVHTCFILCSSILYPTYCPIVTSASSDKNEILLFSAYLIYSDVKDTNPHIYLTGV